MNDPISFLTEHGYTVVFVLYCGCPDEGSSAQVALRLMRLGRQRVRPLAGGLDVWLRLTERDPADEPASSADASDPRDLSPSASARSSAPTAPRVPGLATVAGENRPASGTP